MARIVSSDYIPSIALHVRTILESGSEIDSVLKDDTMVTDLRYVENEEIKKVTGRISRVGYRLKPMSIQYKNAATAKSYFGADVTPTEIDIDCSTEYQSKVVTIPVQEIIEFEGVTDVKRIKCELSYAVNVAVTLTDGTKQEFVIEEGQQLVGLTYLDRGGDKTVDARVVAFRYKTTLEPTDMIVIINNKIKEIDIEAVKSVKAVVTPVTPLSSTAIADAIAASTTGSVYLDAAAFNEAISITSDTTLFGAKAGIPANNLSLRHDDNINQETVLSGKISVSNGATITLDGLTLTKEACLSLSNAKNVTIKNCRITGLTPVGTKSYIVLPGASEMKLDVQNCYFGPNEETKVGKFYNGFELTCKLSDGSIIANNYFADGSTSNNSICIYDAVDGANIIIEKNVWEKSANGVRIGTKGNVDCTIDIIDNEYLSTEEGVPEYAGLLLVQPYGKATTGMENVVITLNGTVHKDNLQLYYLYAGTNDMQFDEYNIPTIIVDNNVEMAPIPRVVEDATSEVEPTV